MKKKYKKRKINKKALTITALILLVVELAVFFGGYWLGSFNAQKKISAQNELNSLNDQPQNVPEQSVEEKIVDKIMEDMSLSDMIYQMMFVTPESLTGVGQVIRAGESTQKALEKTPVGGIIYFSANFKSREQTAEMIKNTQEFSKIPLFIGVDEEGGRVSRLGSVSAMNVEKQPPMREIGETGDKTKAYEIGENLATSLSELGFNVDFAPDADVIISQDNKEIGDRSFGTDPVLVADMVESVVNGLQDNNVSATLKHFPGHGSTTVDSHTGYSSSSRTIDELRAVEFLPFIRGIEADADFVMVSHMTLTNLENEKFPSSMSKEVITDMLLNELGFKGIVITDSFSMGAIVEEYSIADATVKAVSAGVDMILMPSDLEKAHNALVDAVENGTISKERIEESVRKILLLKAEKQLLK